MSLTLDHLRAKAREVTAKYQSLLKARESIDAELPKLEGAHTALAELITEHTDVPQPGQPEPTAEA